MHALVRAASLVVGLSGIHAAWPGGALRAQASPPAPATGPAVPRPAHERLSVFEGTWTSPDMPAGQALRDTCEWLAGGRRHLVCRPRYESSRGTTQHQVTYSYRGADSTYIVTAFLATGQVWTYLGRPEGGRWVFALQGDRRNPAQRLRMLVTPGPDTLRFVEESSENGGAWRVTEDYRYVRVRATPR